VLDYLTTSPFRCKSCCHTHCHSHLCGCASQGCAAGGCHTGMSAGSYDTSASPLPPRPVPTADTVWSDR
jgi:hypothetical protein